MSTTLTPTTPPAAPAPKSQEPIAPIAPKGPPTPPAPVAPAIPPAATPKAPPASIEDGLKKAASAFFDADDRPIVEPPAPVVPPKKEAPTSAAADPAKKEETPPAKPAAAEKDPFEHIKPDDGMTEKSLTGWKALKKEATTKLQEAEKKYSDAMAKLDTYQKSTPAQNEDAARLKEELKQAHDRLAVLDLQNHPDFTRQFVEPKKKALSEAQTLLADNGITDGPDMVALLSKPRAEFAKAVSELAAKMQPYDQGSFVAAMREAHRINGEQATALSKSSELKAQLESKAAAAARSAFEETRTEFSSKVPELQIPEGADEEKVSEIQAYNKARAEAMAEAERYSFGKLTEKEVAQVSQQAAALKVVATHVIPSLQRDLKRSNEMVAQLTAELTAIKKAKNPGQFTETPQGAAPRTPQNPKAITPDFGALAREVGMRQV